MSREINKKSDTEEFDRERKTPIFTNKIFFCVLTAILSYLATLGMGYLSAMQEESPYIGVAEFGFGPLSLFFYILNFVLISRFWKRKDIRLHLISLIVGLLMAFGAVSATKLLMINNLFTAGKDNFLLIFSSLVLTIFTTCLSEEIFLILIKFEESCRKKR